MYNQHWSNIWLKTAKRHGVKAKLGLTDDGRTYCGFYFAGVKVCFAGMSKKGWGIYVNLHKERFGKLAEELKGIITIEKCFCCGRKFDKSDHFGTPWPATCFTSYGNWGSTVIDMFRSDYPPIEIWICDVCLTNKKDEVVGYNPLTETEVMQGQVRGDIMEWYNNA